MSSIEPKSSLRMESDLAIAPRHEGDAHQGDTLSVSTFDGPGSRERRSTKLWWVAGLILLLAAAGGLALWKGGGSAPEGPLPKGDLVAVKRGPLSIRVTSSGSIRSREATVIKNRVEGRTTILSLVEEGKLVKKGDLLVVLDSSALEDEKVEEEIDVETSRAEHVNAQQVLEITKGEGQANVEAAMVKYRLALLDLEKYSGIGAEEFQSLHSDGPRDLFEDDSILEGSVLGQLNSLASDAAREGEAREKFEALLEQLEGSYKQEMRKALNSIIIADAEVRRAKDRFEGSAELARLEYITATELDADKLDYKRKLLDKEVAAGELELLAKFTYKRTIEELVSAVRQSEFALEKANKEAAANVVDAQANLNARRERFVRAEQNLKELNEQIEACTVVAPRAGMVVYGTTGRDRDWREPMAEGVEVYERQDLFRLPDNDSLIADIKIHESVLDKVQPGMPVRITTDAAVERSFTGRVQKIAVLPDAQSRWLNPDLKVYNTTIEVLDGINRLRTGMSCKAEIVLEEYESILHVPIQAVVRHQGKPTVFVPNAEGALEPKVIEVGLDDNRNIVIRQGIEEGTLVSLSPPLEEGEVVPEMMKSEEESTLENMAAEESP